jgi:tetratricopeptide (TPR) repeat protein
MPEKSALSVKWWADQPGRPEVTDNPVLRAVRNRRTCMLQDRMRMPSTAVTEEEISAAEGLRGRGEFTTAFALTQDMLNRAQDDETRMRLLFDVLYCSTRLGLGDVTSGAIAELEKLPEPEMSRIFVDLIQAISHIALGKAQEALDLLDANLTSQFMERENFCETKYEHLAYKGRALAFLARPEESLASLEEAHRMCPEGKRETDILIDQANGLMALKRYEEAFEAASQVLKRGDEEMATLALHYMADCRMSQRMVSEALRLYLEVQKRLPCRLVEEERIKRGISNILAYLESFHPHDRPS